MPTILSIQENPETERYKNLQEIAQLLMNKEVTEYLDLEDAKDELQLLMKIRDWYQNDYQFYMIKIQDHVKGYIRLTHHNPYHRFAILSFALESEYWKKGIMFSSLQKVLNLAFTENALHRIEAQVHENNTRSIKLLERLGFEKEGIQKQNFLIGNQYFNSVMMAKIRM